MSVNNHALFFGNLKPGMPVSTLKHNMVVLFSSLGVEIKPSNVHVTVKPNITYAYVYLPSELEKKLVLDFFAIDGSFSNIYLGDVVHPCRRLKVAPKLTPLQLYGPQKNVSIQNSKEHETSQYPVSSNNHDLFNNIELYCREKYVLGESLGCESRVLEFKRGSGMYLQDCLKGHVSKYVCAFLNSEGGTLLIGVDDNGEVKGVMCNQRLEDKLRQDIDQMIKMITPPVLPRIYHVHFCPVLDQNGRIFDDLKVLDIHVSVGPGTAENLYETSQGEVWIRRDGGVQKLGAGAIQEWTRIKVLEEQQKKNKDLENLVTYQKNIQAERDEYKTQVESLTAQLDEARQQQQKCSTICIIF